MLYKRCLGCMPRLARQKPVLWLHREVGVLKVWTNFFPPLGEARELTIWHCAKLRALARWNPKTLYWLQWVGLAFVWSAGIFQLVSRFLTKRICLWIIAKSKYWLVEAGSKATYSTILLMSFPLNHFYNTFYCNFSKKNLNAYVRFQAKECTITIKWLISSNFIILSQL